jgi:ABC-type polysaccharide/polyol phosphate export permease
MKSFKKFKKQFQKYKTLIWHLAKTDLKLRYHGSVLGYAWTILEPLLLFAVIYTVFSNFRGFRTEYFALQLITAIILFTFFVQGSTSNITCLKKNTNLLTNLYIPHWVFIVASSIYNFFVFSLNIFVLFFFFAFKPYVPSLISIGYFSIYIFAIFVIILTIGFFLAPLYIKFRDIGSIWKVITRALFYATPVIWTLSIIPIQYHKIILMNPLAFVIHFTKVGLIGNHNPSFQQLALFLGIVFIFFGISIFTYNKTDKKIVESL